MGLLSWTASTAAKQAALMALLLSIPGLWWTYSGLTEADLEDPAKLASAHVLISLGFAWFIAGVAYKALPLDLIPDWIPFVGKLDDMAAGVMAGVGLTTMWVGWTYGTGPKPPEAIAAATHLTAAYEYSAPARGALVGALKAGYRAAVPVAAVAAPAVEMAWSKVGPHLRALRRQMLGAALDAHAAQVEAASEGPAKAGLRWLKGIGRAAANAVREALEGGVGYPKTTEGVKKGE